MTLSKLDYCFDKRAANILKTRIESYWRRKGKAIQVWLEESPLSGKYENQKLILYSVRSDLKFDMTPEE